MTVEVCGDCRFDSSQYTTTDARRSLLTMATRWRWAAEGIDESVLPRVGERTYADAVTAIDEEARELDQAYAAGAVTRDEILDAVHRMSHELMGAGRAIHALGHGAPSARGEVAGLFASGGGVPKQPIDRAVIGCRGVDGDRQAARQHHGRVWQALCLWSADVISRLQGEGHPIAFGNAGENVTIRDVDWPTLRPGARLAIGEVLVEVSAYATPCQKNAAWFLDRDFNRMAHEREPGISRLYASVLRDGVVRPGDTVIVEPD